MKAKNVSPGKRYAVRTRFHGTQCAVEHITVVDYQGNNVTGLVRRYVQTNHDLSVINLDGRKYVEREVTVVVPGADVICLSDDYPIYVAHQSDGRVDRPKLSIVGDGQVVLQEQAPAPPWVDHVCKFAGRPPEAKRVARL